MTLKTTTHTKNNLLRKLIFCTLIALAFFGTARLYYRLTDDFRLANMTHPMPFKEAWEVPLMTDSEKKTFDEILNQDFFYIGKGAQSYAFSSADNQYVMKFFKFKHLKPSIFIDLIPSIGPLKDYKQAQIDRKNRLLDSVFDGYRLAYDVHADETGLIYVHLNKSDNLHKNLKVKDKIGLEHTVNLDEVPFILQIKVETTRTVMNELMKKRDLTKAKERLKQIFKLYLSEYSKGIYDRDHGVLHNTGFAGEQPIHLDVGKLTKDDRMKNKEFYKPDLLLIVRKFNIWFKTNYPNDYAEMHDYMNAEVAFLLGEKKSNQ